MQKPGIFAIVIFQSPISILMYLKSNVKQGPPLKPPSTENTTPIETLYDTLLGQ